MVLIVIILCAFSFHGVNGDEEPDHEETKEMLDQMSQLANGMGSPDQSSGSDDSAVGKMTRRYKWFENIYSFIENWPDKSDEEKDALVKQAEDSSTPAGETSTDVSTEEPVPGEIEVSTEDFTTIPPEIQDLMEGSTDHIPQEVLDILAESDTEAPDEIAPEEMEDMMESSTDESTEEPPPE